MNHPFRRRGRPGFLSTRKLHGKERAPDVRNNDIPPRLRTTSMLSRRTVAVFFACLSDPQSALAGLWGLCEDKLSRSAVRSPFLGSVFDDPEPMALKGAARPGYPKRTRKEAYFMSFTGGLTTAASWMTECSVMPGLRVGGRATL